MATFPVDRSKLAELGRALLDPDPVWHDPAVARDAGFDAVPTPPTVTVIADHWIPGGTIGPALALGADLPRLLHGEVSWTYEVPVRLGDELTARVTLASVDRREGKRGGAMTLVGLETTYTRADGVLVARKHETFIETAEATK